MELLYTNKVKMDIHFFMLAFVHAMLSSSDGFLIQHARKQGCLLANGVKVMVVTCNMTSRWQDWEWTEQGKLRLRQQGQCLSLVSNTSRYTHPLTLRDCAGGLRWKCYHNEPGHIGLADQEMFLKKVGYLAMLKAETKYYDSWLRYQLGDNSKPVTLSICPTQDDYEANALKEALLPFQEKKAKWQDNVPRPVTKQPIEQTTFSSHVTSPSSSTRSEEPYSTMTYVYNQTEKELVYKNADKDDKH